MSTTEAHKVLAVVTAIMRQPAAIGTDYGNWNGERHVGFAAKVDDNAARVQRVSTGPTELDAACSLLARVRSLYPFRSAAASRTDECAEGMAIYAAYVEAKADAAIAESAVRLADMRTPVRGADLSPAVAAE